MLERGVACPPSCSILVLGSSPKPFVSDTDSFNIADDRVLQRAQEVVDAYDAAVTACRGTPPFRPLLRMSATAGATHYDPATRTVVLIPYEALDPQRRAAMERFASIGTLGLSGQQQYVEVFNNLLVAHELGHWLQDVAQRPLNRWQAEYQANRLMVSFWRDHPAAPPAPSTEMRLANFIALSPPMRAALPDVPAADYESVFLATLGEIEGNPVAYAAWQKLMVRTAMAETPAPTFCKVVEEVWPSAG